MNRRKFLRTAGVAAAGTALSPFSLTSWGETVTTRGPNVLFVLADQWRFSAFSHETDPLVRTPNMDRLAAQGVRFTRMYAANPVCGPNRASILTGRFSHQTGMVRNGLMLPPAELCVASVFRDAGYATHYIGKWHLDGSGKPGFVPPGWRRRGFETFEGFNAGHYYPTGAQYFTNEGKLVHPGGFEPTYQSDLAVDFMKRHREQPFFCFLSWGPPHSPYQPPEQFARFAKMDKLEWRPNVPESLRNSPRLRKELAGYYGLCEALDHEMGRLLNALEQLGLADNTLVVFSSDHGDMQGSHGLYRKNLPYEESLHIPLFMRLPGRIKPGQKPTWPASSVDLMPTLLGLCALKKPGTCVGHDLSGAVAGAGTPTVESIYAEGLLGGKMKEEGGQGGKAQPGAEAEESEDDSVPPAGGEWRAVVAATHKLVMHVNGSEQLFDLAKDPGEMTDLAGKPEHAAVQRHLQDEAKRWIRDTADPYPRAVARARKLYSDPGAAPARRGRGEP